MAIRSRSRTGWWVCQRCGENPVKDEGDPPYICTECREPFEPEFERYEEAGSGGLTWRT